MFGPQSYILNKPHPLLYKKLIWLARVLTPSITVDKHRNSFTMYSNRLVLTSMRCNTWYALGRRVQMALARILHTTPQPE